MAHTITRDQAVLGFLRISVPEEVARAEKLADDLIESGVKGVEPAPLESSNALPRETR